MLDELSNALSSLVGVLKVEDLEDPEIASLVFQLVSVLDPEPPTLPQASIDELSLIDNKVQRFKEAAKSLKEVNTQSLKQLAESMKASGLLKTQEKDANTQSG